MTQVDPHGEMFQYMDPEAPPPIAQPAPVGQFTVTGPVTQTVTIQVQMPAAMLCAMSRDPVEVECPHCKVKATTTIEKTVGFRNIFLAVMMTCVACCILIPFIWDACKDVTHYCSNCKMMLGKFVPQTRGGRGRRGRRRRRRRR